LVWPSLGLIPRSAVLEASTLTITPPVRLWSIFQQIPRTTVL
jgi:hypothetical protein